MLILNYKWVPQKNTIPTKYNIILYSNNSNIKYIRQNINIVVILVLIYILQST